MTNIINSEYGLVISSRIVAEELGKRHSDMIRTLDEILTNANFRSLIIESNYKDKKGEMRKEYLLTKDGLTLYLFNIRGYQDFKIAYIQKFNEMEKAINNSRTILTEKDWALKRIHDRAKQAEYIEDKIIELRKKLDSIYEEIEGVARMKRETSFKFFDDFKGKGKYDASKEKLPEIIIPNDEYEDK